MLFVYNFRTLKSLTYSERTLLSDMIGSINLSAILIVVLRPKGIVEMIIKQEN